MNRRRKSWTVILLGGFLIVLLFVLVVHHRKVAAAEAQKSEQAPQGVPVTTATAKAGSITVYLNAIGTVTPVYTDALTAQVTGVITAVHYREGQVVRKGDPLIDLDDRPYAAQLEQAQGTLEHDQNLLAEAEMDLDRYKDAWARNGIPRQTLEDQEKLADQDQGTVKTDQGLVSYDQTQVAYCHIASPIDGRVGLRLIDPGNLVTANGNTTLLVITQIQPITVIFTLAEDSLDQVLSQMRRGTTLSVEAWDRQMSKKIAAGQLETVDNQIDTTTGTVKLRATFANRDNALFPNQFVNTRLAIQTLQNQILIPSSAVQRNGDAAFVYVIQNAKATETTVKPGVTDAGMTAVQGIQAGAVVANSSFEKLQNGSAVTISTVQLPSDDSSGTSAP
jgi:multidrug efflux system membrane fusion protein